MSHVQTVFIIKPQFQHIPLHTANKQSVLRSYFCCTKGLQSQGPVSYPLCRELWLGGQPVRQRHHDGRQCAL